MADWENSLLCKIQTMVTSKTSRWVKKQAELEGKSNSKYIRDLIRDRQQLKEYLPILKKLLNRMKEKHNEFGTSYLDMSFDQQMSRLGAKRIAYAAAIINDDEAKTIHEAIDCAIWLLLIANTIRRGGGLL